MFYFQNDLNLLEHADSGSLTNLNIEQFSLTKCDKPLFGHDVDVASVPVNCNWWKLTTNVSLFSNVKCQLGDSRYKMDLSTNHED